MTPGLCGMPPRRCPGTAGASCLGSSVFRSTRSGWSKERVGGGFGAKQDIVVEDVALSCICGWPVVGCAYSLKAALCFIFPATQRRTLRRVSRERAWELVVPGVIYIALGSMLSYSHWQN